MSVLLSLCLVAAAAKLPAVGSAATSPSPPSAGAAAGCYTNKLDFYDGGGRRMVRLELSGVSCRQGVSVARRYTGAPRSQCAGSACAIGWSDGWACASASYTTQQQTRRIFSCSGGTRRVSAWFLA
jgi:hypothetical protein